MRIKKHILGITLAVLLLGIAGTSSAVAAKQLHRRREVSLEDINRQCSKRLDADGFGEAVIKAGHIRNQTARITVPCKLIIKSGATLQFTNVRLEARSLILQDSDKPKQPAHLVINKSQLRSVDGGFQVQLKSPSSTVSIKESSIDFPLSAGVAVGSDDDDTSVSLKVESSSFASKSPESEGIILVSTGKTIVKSSKFQFADPQSQALLLGSSCQLVDNINANTRCHGP